MQKISRVLALAGALAAGSVVPADAAWTKIGRVDFAYGVDKDSAYGNFGGPATALQLTARDSDVSCKYVRATFGNGTTTTVFQGMLPQGRPTRVDLPGDRRNVKKLAFECRSFVRGGAHIDIEADVDAYRDQWRKNPVWANLWNALQPPPPPRPPSPPAPPPYNPSPNNWVPIGTERFVGPIDKASNAAGWGGRRITALGLKPVDADAQCKRVSATFGNGTTQDLDLNRGGVAYRGRTYKIDLPGTVRNVVKLNLVCRAIGAPAVTIQIYGNQ
jgi:hypothetical protein